MVEFLAMGGYAEFVWSAFGLAVVTLVYNLVSARRRMRTALENAALNARRIRGDRQSNRTDNGRDT
ncbi:MAG: heme exporter protein CcmD [Gammaproteobacteria bacterium]